MTSPPRGSARPPTSASYVCEGQALGFGHPFFFNGDTALALHTADALGIVSDPFFTFKLADVGAAVGTVDQDRFAGLRASLGASPELIPVTSSVTALDTGRSRRGRTDVALGDALPDLAFFHTASNVLSVLDQFSGGSASVAFTVNGTHAGGEPWRLERANRFSSGFDIAFESGFELLNYLGILLNNPFAEVEFGAVDVTVEVTERQRRYDIGEVLVAVGDAEPVPARTVEAGPGDVVRLQVTLVPFQEDDPVVVGLELTVPDDAPPGGGFIEITGGQGDLLFDPFFCLFVPEECPGAGDAGSLDELIEQLETAPRNDELVAALRLFPEVGPPPGEEPLPLREDPTTGPPPPEGADGVPPPGVVGPPEGEEVVAEARARLDRVVRGFDVVEVFPRFEPPVPGFEVDRVAGADRIGTAIALSRLAFAGPGGQPPPPGGPPPPPGGEPVGDGTGPGDPGLSLADTVVIARANRPTRSWPVRWRPTWARRCC